MAGWLMSKPPQRRRDKDWEIKTQWELSDRESIRKKKTVGWAFAAALIRSRETRIHYSCCVWLCHSSFPSAWPWAPPPLMQSFLPRLSPSSPSSESLHSLILPFTVPLIQLDCADDIFHFPQTCIFHVGFTVCVKTQHNSPDNKVMHLFWN